MKHKIIKILLFLIILFVSTSAQSLKLKVGGGYDFFLRQTESQDNSFGFQNSTEEPSLANFYKNDLGMLFDGSLNFMVNEDEEIEFIIGFSFKSDSKESSSKNEGYILGANLNQSIYTPYIGVGKYLNGTELRPYLYGILGISFASVEGEGTIPGFIEEDPVMFDAVYHYSGGTGARLGGGIEFSRPNTSGFVFGFQTYLDFGSVKRGKIDLKYKGNSIGEANPEGAIKIHNNSISVLLTLGYQFSFIIK